MVKKLKILSLQIANTTQGIWIMFLIAFADASFIPLPSTTLFLAFVMLSPGKRYQYIISVVLGTLIGAVTAYALGHFAWIDSSGEYTGLLQFLFDHIPGFSPEAYDKIHILYAKWGVWILCAATITPIPYGIFSIASGVFEINFSVFLFITVLCQGAKFLFLAYVSVKLGSQIKILSIRKLKPSLLVVTVFIIIVLVVLNVV